MKKISLYLSNKILEEINKLVEDGDYHNPTEVLRAAIDSKILKLFYGIQSNPVEIDKDESRQFSMDLGMEVLKKIEKYEKNRSLFVEQAAWDFLVDYKV